MAANGDVEVQPESIDAGLMRIFMSLSLFAAHKTIGEVSSFSVFKYYVIHLGMRNSPFQAAWEFMWALRKPPYHRVFFQFKRWRVTPESLEFSRGQCQKRQSVAPASIYRTYQDEPTQVAISWSQLQAATLSFHGNP